MESHIPLEEIHQTEEYKGLTSQQQNWFNLYAASGDPRQATIDAYKTAKKPQAYQVQLTQKLLSAPRIRAVLAKFFQWDSREVFMRDLESQIRRAKGATKVGLISLQAKLLGLLPVDATIDAGTFGSAHAVETPADPAVTGKGDIHAEVAPKPARITPRTAEDEQSERFLRMLRGK